MAERHADPLFSAAYDDELDHPARRRFDAHLEGCARCAGAFDDYRTALDAVRTLPAVAMPATVRLPMGAPRAAPGRAALLGRLRDALLHPQPVTAAATLAAVGVAAVVLAVHHGGGGSQRTVADSAVSGAGSAPYSAVQPRAAAPGVPPAPQALAAGPTPCLVTSVPPAGGGGTSPGYANAARTAAGSGRELVLATPSHTYGAGQSVPVYARLTGSPAGSAPADVVPCVTLETDTGGTGVAAAATAPGGSVMQGRAGAGSAPATPLAVATAAPAASGGDSSRKDAAGPLLTVVIPPDVRSGTRLRLVAFIPAYADGNTTDRPLRVELIITVR